MPHLTFATAQLADVAALDRLINSAYRGEGSKRGWTTEADLLGGQRTDTDKLRELVTSTDNQLELLLVDGELTGCVQLRWEGDAAYVGMLTIDPGRQAAGLGRALLAHAERIAAAHGCRRTRMTVIRQRDVSLAYYERRGYVRTGATEPFPVGDPRFGLPKVDGLLFVVLEKTLD